MDSKERARHMSKDMYVLMCIYNLKIHPKGTDTNKVWNSHNSNYYEVIKKHKVISYFTKKPCKKRDPRY